MVVVPRSHESQGLHGGHLEPEHPRGSAALDSPVRNWSNEAEHNYFRILRQRSPTGFLQKVHKIIKSTITI